MALILRQDKAEQNKRKRDECRYDNIYIYFETNELIDFLSYWLIDWFDMSFLIYKRIRILLFLNLMW